MNPEQFQRIMNNAQQMQQFRQQFAQYGQQFQGMSPQQGMPGPSTIQNMMNSGAMSQQDFERCRQMANQIMGTNY